MTRILALATVLLSGCATHIHMRDGTITHGSARRVSDTEVEVRDGRERTRIALADVSHVRTRGHRLLYGAAAMSAVSIGATVATATAFGCAEEDSDVCGLGIGLIGIPVLLTVSLTTLGLFIRGLILRRRDLRAFHRRPATGLLW